MSQTLADLSIKVDTSDLDKAEAGLKKVGSAAKDVSTDQSKLIEALNKTAAAMTDLEKHTSKVSSSLQDVAKSFNPIKLGAAALAGAISALSYGALKDMVSGVIEGAASLQKLSVQTGISVNDLSIMKSVAAQSGTSMDSVTTAVTKFEKSLAASSTATSLQSRAFKALGIDTSDTTKTTSDYLGMAADKLSTLQDGWQKNNIVMALFGKSGTEVNQFLSDYANKGDMVAKVTAEQAEQAEHYERTMTKLNATTNQYKQLIGMALLPVLSSIADEFLKMVQTTGKLDSSTKELIKNDVQSWAFGIAKFLGAAIDDAIIFGDVLKGLAQAVGTFAGAVVTSGEVMNKILHGDFSGAWALYKTNVVNFGTGMKDAWNTATQFSTKYYDLVNKAQEDLNKKTGGEPGKPKTVPINIGDRDAKEKTAGPNLDGELAGLQKKLLLQKDLYASDALRLMIDAGYYTKYDQAQVKDLQRLQSLVDAQERVNAIKKRDVEISKQMQDATGEGIRNKVMAQYGKTTNDANIAVQAYKISMAEAELQSLKNAGATQKEIDALTDKIAVMQGEQAANEQKKNDATALKEQTTSFNYGWTQAFAKYKEDAADASKTAGAVFSSVTSHMSDSLANFVMTGKLNFKDLTKSILSDLAKIAAEKMVAGMAEAMFANGGAFSGGTQFFADGGVVSSPTAFGMAGGQMGVMGEAGPEAIVPLKRGQDGKLGVAMSGAGSSNVVINTPINITMTGGDAGSASDRAALVKQVQDVARTTFRQELTTAMRPGGVLNRVR